MRNKPWHQLGQGTALARSVVTPNEVVRAARGIAATYRQRPQPNFDSLRHQKADKPRLPIDTQVKRVSQEIADAPGKEVSQQHEVIQESTHPALNTRARSISFVFIAAIPRACFLPISLDQMKLNMP